MKKADEIYENFLAALRFKVKEKGHGSQKLLAAGTNISVTYLSKIIKNKKKTSFENQIEICRFFGYEYPNFLKLGEAVLEAEKDHPDIARDNQFDIKKHRETGSCLQAINLYLQKLSVDVSFSYQGEATEKANVAIDAISELRSALVSEVIREHPEMDLNQKVAVYYGKEDKEIELFQEGHLSKFKDRNRAWARRIITLLLDIEQAPVHQETVERILKSISDQIQSYQNTELCSNFDQ